MLVDVEEIKYLSLLLSFTRRRQIILQTKEEEETA